MRASTWLIAIVWLVACGAAIPELPSRGGPAWFEVKSEHFTLWTDASLERGRELVRELERRRLVITTAMRFRAKAMAFVIAPRSARELGAWVDWGVAGHAWTADNLTGQPGILFAANDTDDNQITANHEVAHLISFGIIKNQPRWLAEGIATYFETMDLISDNDSVQVGIPRDDRLRALRASRPLEASKLFVCASDDCPSNMLYATSWVVVSFLLNEHYDELSRYLQNVNQLPPVDPLRAWHDSMVTMAPDERQRYRQTMDALRRDQEARAWREAFPDLPPDRLDRELFAWRRTGKIGLPRIKVAFQDMPVTERVLGDADILASRAFLRLMFTDETAAAHSDAEAALALERTNVLARLVQTVFTHSVSAEDARATAAAHPDDWRALRLVALAMNGSPEGDQARDRLCTMTANQASECERADASRAASR